MNPNPQPLISAPAARGLRRYLGLYAALWRNSVVRELGFKANFFLWIIVEALWFFLQLSFIAVIYLHTDRILDWTKWQVVLLIGASHFMQQLFTAFFLTNCVNLSELVRTGRLDFLLLLPVNARFLVSLRNVDLGAFVNAGSALVTIFYALLQLHYFPGPWRILGFLLLCGCGLLIHYSLMFLMAAVCFWTVRAQGIVWGYYNLFNIARLPDTVFRGAFRIIFTFFIPMLLVSNVPVKVLLERLASPWEIPMLIGMTAACFAASEAFWRYSLRHYTSASS